jgi:hypothetical protein
LVRQQARRRPDAQRPSGGASAYPDACRHLIDGAPLCLHRRERSGVEK